MSAPPELVLPKPPRLSPWAVGASVALHGALLAVFFFVLRRESPPALRPRFIALGSREMPAERMIVLTPPSAAAAPGSGMRQASIARNPPARGATPSQAPAPRTAPEASLDSLGARPGPAATRVATPPSLQSGLLWDRRPSPPSGAGRTRAQLIDSAVTAMLDHYRDSLAALPNGVQVLPRSWKATIGGQEFGLDPMFITVAGLKIPSLILLFLPLPAGNESEALDNGARMRQEDYDLAMPRDAAAADQRAEAKAIRKRKAEEEKLRRKQSEPGPRP